MTEFNSYLYEKKVGTCQGLAIATLCLLEQLLSTSGKSKLGVVGHAVAGIGIAAWLWNVIRRISTGGCLRGMYVG